MNSWKEMFFIIRAAFAGFDAEIVANFTERQIASVATDCNLDLNKVRGAVNNANRILQVRLLIGPDFIS
ncbi:DNA-3-methyladenine glycosylase I, partial [Mycobacterium kansasii]